MKEQILNAIETFGLTMDYDQWDVEGKEWIRVIAPKWMNVKISDGGKYRVLILYKADIKEINDALEQLRDFQYRLGEYLFKQKLHDLIL